MTFFKSVTIFSGVVVGLCVLAVVLLWRLGGLNVAIIFTDKDGMILRPLLIYPLAWLCDYAPYFLLRNRIGAQARLRWRFVSAAIAVLLWLASVAWMLQALRTMR